MSDMWRSTFKMGAASAASLRYKKIDFEVTLVCEKSSIRYGFFLPAVSDIVNVSFAGVK